MMTQIFKSKVKYYSQFEKYINFFSNFYSCEIALNSNSFV